MNNEIIILLSLMIIIIISYIFYRIITNKKIQSYIKSTIIYQKLKLNRIIKRRFKQGYKATTFNEKEYYPIVIESIKKRYDFEYCFGTYRIKNKKECELINKKNKKMNGWISVEDRLPEEHDSVFKDCYGTDEWKEGMFKSISDEVIVALEFRDGSKEVTVNKMIDGHWKRKFYGLSYKVTHWQPLPQLPKEGEK